MIVCEEGLHGILGTLMDVRGVCLSIHRHLTPPECDQYACTSILHDSVVDGVALK